MPARRKKAKAKRALPTPQHAKLNLKPTSLWYANQQLHGSLCMMSRHDFLSLYVRFMDISPSEKPGCRDETCNPIVLVHEIQGLSWAPSSLIDSIKKVDRTETEFLAVTDNEDVFDGDHGLGKLWPSGFLQLSSNSTNDIIIALPSEDLLSCPLFTDLSARQRVEVSGGEERLLDIDGKIYEDSSGSKVVGDEVVPGFSAPDGVLITSNMAVESCGKSCSGNQATYERVDETPDM